MRNTSGELLEMFLLHVSKKNEMGNSFGELLEMPGRFSFASCSLEMGFVTLVPILCLFVSYFVLLLMERKMGSSLGYSKKTCTWCYSYTQEAMHPNSFIAAVSCHRELATLLSSEHAFSSPPR